MVDETVKRSTPLLGSGTGTQLFLGLLWLGITVWTTHATITTSEDGPSGALGAAAEALPGIVTTAMVTGASIAAAAGSRWDRALARMLVGVVAGVLFGIAVAAGLKYAYGGEDSVTVLAVTVGLACVVGGAAAGLPGTVLDAALWGVSWVFFAFVILGVWQPNAVKLLGGGPDAEPTAQVAAEERFIYITAVAAGLFGALQAYRFLRAERHALGWYMVTGALPGLILLAGEALTTVGGASLVDLVHGFNAGDAPIAELSSADRLRDALIVLGVGAFVAMLGGIRANREAAREDALEAAEAAREAELEAARAAEEE